MPSLRRIQHVGVGLRGFAITTRSPAETGHEQLVRFVQDPTKHPRFRKNDHAEVKRNSIAVSAQESKSNSGRRPNRPQNSNQAVDDLLSRIKHTERLDFRNLSGLNAFSGESTADALDRILGSDGGHTASRNSRQCNQYVQCNEVENMIIVLSSDTRAY